MDSGGGCTTNVNVYRHCIVHLEIVNMVNLRYIYFIKCEKTHPKKLIMKEYQVGDLNIYQGLTNWVHSEETET